MQQLRGAVSGLLLLVMVLGVGGCVEGTGEANRAVEKVEGGYLPSRDDYYGGSAVDRGNAWVGGERGLIVHLIDGGKQVELQDSGLPFPQPSFFSVSFVDAQNGLLSGEFATILRTTDGGKRWERVPVDIPVPEEEVLALGADPSQDKIEKRPGALPHIFALKRSAENSLHVWGVGDRGTIIHSPDGGKSWENLSLGQDIILNGVDFVSDTEGWVVGEFGTIVHTRDGGHTWEWQDNILELPKYTERGVSDEEALLASIPLLTLDGLYFYTVRFVDPQEGYVAGANGFMLHTTDGGQTWRYKPGDTYDHFYEIALLGDGKGVLAGSVGTILLKEPNKWWYSLMDVKDSLLTWLRGVSFAADHRFGVACGGGGAILISEDGGRRWNKIPADVLKMAGVEANRKMRMGG